MMIQAKLLPLCKGLIKKVLIHRKFTSSTSGTDQAAYCYATWLRHVIHAHAAGYKCAGSVVAELGPGDTLGMGLSALLCGADKYYAMDVYQYWNIEHNLVIFDELVELFRKRSPIPDQSIYPKLFPVLDNYEFPHHIFTDEMMERNLHPERLQQIREAISLMCTDECTSIRCYIPWNKKENIDFGTVDYFFSQAVLEYVDDLEQAYRKFNKWIKPGGFMSHCIDFSSHGITKPWNAHWTFSAGEWKLAHGNLQIVLNRLPRSGHLELLKNHGFELLFISDKEVPVRQNIQSLHRDYRHLTQKDLDTYASFFVARKLQA